MSNFSASVVSLYTVESGEGERRGGEWGRDEGGGEKEGRKRKRREGCRGRDEE